MEKALKTPHATVSNTLNITEETKFSQSRAARRTSVLKSDGHAYMIYSPRNKYSSWAHLYLAILKTHAIQYLLSKNNI